MIRRHPLLFLFLVLAAVLLGRAAYLYIQVGQGITQNDTGATTLFYGRPLEIRQGDCLDNIRFIERLNRLSYRAVREKPSREGTYMPDKNRIRIFFRNKGNEGAFYKISPVEIRLQDGRVAALLSSQENRLESIRWEPEEIGRLTGSGVQAHHPVDLADISPDLQNAVIASEDRHFYRHFGIDPVAIGRATLTNIREQRFAQGASTITQQLAKNYFLSPRKTFARKLHEVELALALELRYSKKEILKMYLNKIYLGQNGSQGIYGVEDASKFYFSKRARDISLTEAALLAGIIHAPNRYNLVRNHRTAKNRRNSVLGRMHKLSMISKEAFDKASGAPVVIRSAPPSADLSSYFIDYIMRTTREELESERLYRTGHRYFTTLDPFHQALAEKAVAGGLETIAKKARPAPEPLQAALVAVDPKTGALTAMVGGRSYKQSRFNRAVDAHRQPGSAFKSFVLLAALDQPLESKRNLTLSTLVSGEPISLATPEGLWTPSNFENKKYGSITIRRAIEDSVNTATVRLADDVGFAEVVKTARRSGIQSPLLPVGSMALGSFEVTPLEIAYAYTTIASGGVRFEPFSLFSVTTARGDSVISRTAKSKRTIDPRVAYLAGYALEGVLARGTAREAKLLKIDFPVSGKTGTTNSNRDSWFVSFTPDIVCAVWVGYDSGADTGLTGAAGALRINAAFLRALYSRSGPSAFSVPDGIETAVIDPDSGYLATTLCPKTFNEAYIQGTAPTEKCPDHPVNPVLNAIRNKMRDAGNFLRKFFR